MKISAYIATSVDGFIARPNGDLDWLPGSEGNAEEKDDYGFQEFFSTIDALVMGRKTFEMVLSFGKWPYSDMRVVVLSHTLKRVPGRLPTSVSVTDAQPLQLVEKLKASGTEHVYVDGGKTIQSFLRAGLVDEMIITRVPVLIGRGIPLFGAVEDDIHLQLVSSRFFHNGFVQDRYHVKRQM